VPTVDQQLLAALSLKLTRGPLVVVGNMKSDGNKAPLPPAAQVTNLGKDTNKLAKTKIFLDSLPDQFPPNDINSLDVNFVWGVRDVDLQARYGIWQDPFATNKGTPVYQLWNGGTPDEQEALAKVCENLQSSAITKRIKRCLMLDFKKYVLGLDNGTFPSGYYSNAPFPIHDRTAFVKEFKTFAGISKDVGFSKDATKLTWIRSIFRSKVPNSKSSFEKYQDYTKWNDVLKMINSNHTFRSLPPAIQTSSGWVDMMTEIACVTGAKKCAVIAIIFVFIVVMNIAGNISIGGYAFGAVATTVLITLGIFAPFWTFGAVEAIIISVMVGLSCNYIVHLCDAYATCGLTWHKPDLKDTAQRSVRVRAALAQVGVPLGMSAMLTCLAGFILWFCTIHIYSKAAAVTIVNTIVAAGHVFFFLPAILLALGPENFKGSFSREWVLVRGGFSAFALGMGILMAYAMSIDDPV
jgi:hypothetical protein